MLKPAAGVMIYVYLEPVDMRKALDGLSVVVMEHFASDLTRGDLYLFFNKKRDKVKILYWDRNGFVLHYKRLEKHKFVIPRNERELILTITEVQLHGLLAGLDFMLMKQFSDIDYTEIY